MKPPGASRRASQNFPCRVCGVAAGLRTPCRVCLCASHQERQVGVEPRFRRRRQPREDQGEVWAVPDRPRPGRALGTGGAVARRLHSSGAARPSLAFPRRCRASGASPPATHPPGAAFVWEPREEEKRRETAAADLTEGAWSAGGGARGRVAAGECARLAGELRGGGPAPRAPRLAWPTRAEPESLLHRHTPTELHRIPPSTRRPRWPPPRLGQQDPAPSPGLVRRAKNPLIFFPPSLQPSLVWAAAAAAGG